MLEGLLVAQGAPTLARLKTGSLFTARGDRKTLTGEIVRLNAALDPRGVRLTALRWDAERALLYLYRERALRDTLADPDVRAFLTEQGYGDLEVSGALATLRARLCRTEFPHEIGVFLGYPLADVIGFIRHEGKDCLAAGYWKCYDNPEAARRSFERLRRCRDVYVRRFAEGTPLTRLTVQNRPEM